MKNKKRTKTKIAIAVCAIITFGATYYFVEVINKPFRNNGLGESSQSIDSILRENNDPRIGSFSDDSALMVKSSGFNKKGYDIEGGGNFEHFSSEAPVKLEENNETTEKLSQNSIKNVNEDPISTFSSDVDDGSYRLFYDRAIGGRLMAADFIRTEEFINAFQYDYIKPKNNDIPFSSNVEISESPWSDNYLMKIGVQGYEYTLDNLPAVNLVFLVDVSGSMAEELPVIKNALKMLVNKLRDEDSIAIVTYAGHTSVTLKSTKIKNKNIIFEGIEKLSSNGGTNGEAGINLAYKEANKNFSKGGVNRILLASDGDFNVGINNRNDLKDLIKEKRKSGITFSTIGIGGGNYRDDMMENMANVGNGAYTFIGDMIDAKRVFADRFISTLKNIAKDVKFQVEFNPETVKEYRLIGYENRMLKKEDFNNDKIDAGEIPSGMSVTAIYEVTLVGQKGMFPESRYGDEKKTENIHSSELGFLKIRYKEPDATKSELLEFKIDKNLIGQEVNDDFKFATAVAGFAQVYKDSDFISQDYNYDSVINSLSDLDLKNEKLKFKELVETVESLKK